MVIDGKTHAIVYPDHWVLGASSEEVGIERSDSNPKRISTTKRSSKSLKSKKPVYQYANSSSKSSDDTTTSTFQGCLGRMLNLLFLVLLVFSGAVRIIMIFNDVIHGQADSAVGHSVIKLVDAAGSDLMRNKVSNETVGDNDFGTSLDIWCFGMTPDKTEPCRNLTSSSMTCRTWAYSFRSGIGVVRCGVESCKL